MAAPILSTKLRVPPARAKRVSRPRLLDRLDEGLACSLALISAPAGFGKTSLLVEWAGRGGQDLAWLALDEGDNDPVRFLVYLLAALQTVDEGLGAGLGELLQTPRFAAPVEFTVSSLSPLTEFLSTLSNQIADRACASPLVLVLDDYHLIHADPVHTVLRFLLDNLPGRLHVYISSRSDPPLPLARLRGRGQLVELRAADLQFTPVEAAEFLHQVMGVDLPVDLVNALTTRTEGWITGLQMASLTLRALPPGPESAAGFVRAFTGTHRYVGDYLIEEVLQREPLEIQSFLFSTSILDRLSAPLCDAVLSGPDHPYTLPSPSVATLERLDRSNLFTFPIDDQCHWYRYHPLFAELLQKRLLQEQPDRLPVLYARASRWSEQNNLPAEAIQYALAGKDFESAARLVEDHVEAMLMRSEIVTVLGWLEGLPDEIVHAHPLLCAYHAIALMMVGRPFEEVDAHIQLASSSPDGAGAAAVIRAILATYGGNTEASIRLSQAALDLLPESNVFLRSVVSWNSGMAYFMIGDTAKTLQMLGQAGRQAEQAGNWMLAVVALTHTAETCIAQGRLQQAQAYYEQALGLATDSRGQLLPIAGSVLVGMAELHRQWNDLDTAAAMLDRGLQQTARWGELGMLEGYFVLANILLSRGDFDGAQRIVDKLQPLAVRFDSTRIDDIYASLYQVKVHFRRGAWEPVQQWLADRQRSPTADARPEGNAQYFYQLDEFERGLLARAWLAGGQPRRALETLALLESQARQAGRLGSLAEIHLLQALAFHALGDPSRAYSRLNESLALAESGGYIRLYVDEGQPVESLLRAACPRLDQRLAAYAQKLLDAFAASAATKGSALLQVASQIAPQTASPPSTELVESLNARELEVLRLLAAGLSNREIASRLIVALSTVKWHTINLYAKLGVHSRTQALARARQLGLL